MYGARDKKYGARLSKYGARDKKYGARDKFGKNYFCNVLSQPPYNMNKSSNIFESTP
jgi:hypothetical protein